MRHGRTQKLQMSGPTVHSYTVPVLWLYTFARSRVCVCVCVRGWVHGNVTRCMFSWKHLPASCTVCVGNHKEHYVQAIYIGD